VPIILQKEVYVTASLVGGIIFILFRDAGFESNWIDVATVTTVIAIRMFTIKFNMHLPKI